MQFLRAKDVAQLIGVNQSTIWRWRQQNGFPSPINLGPNTVVWSSISIESWINSKANKTES
jgi:prophage regulatory protein